jgi:hypothetical protein
MTTERRSEKSKMLLLLLLLTVVTAVHGRYANYQRPEFASRYEQRLDDYSPLRYHETVFISEQTGLSGRQGPPVRSGLSSQQIQDIVDYHNTLRAGEGASNMEVLKWNPQLAKLGQQWSDLCNFAHGQPTYSVADVGYDQIGQNIWANSNPSSTVKDAVQAWFDEKPFYAYDSMACQTGKMCGHYTQVTWGQTREVGCGLTNCSTISGMTMANFMVCNYGPPGNYVGVNPFKKGPACTSCDSGRFYCTKNNLCDSTCSGSSCGNCAASCGKCGTRTSDCQCQCKPGFTGVACDSPCQDNHKNCGANPGWPPSWCTADHPYVISYCPKLCKVCQVSDGSCSLKSDDPNAEDLEAGNSNFKAELSEFVEKIEGQLLRHNVAETRMEEDHYVSNLDESEDKKLADLIKAVKKLTHD